MKTLDEYEAEYSALVPVMEDYIRAKKAQLFDRGISSNHLYPTGKFNKTGELFYFEDENSTAWMEGDIRCYLHFFRDDIYFTFNAYRDKNELIQLTTYDTDEIDKAHESIMVESKYDIALRETIARNKARIINKQNSQITISG
jgi:hypothetical protein